MSRILFRALVAITLAIMFVARLSGGRLPLPVVEVFYYWFIASIFVFAAFGIVSAVRAWRDPFNRRAYLFDVLLAAIWVPYWFANLR